MDLTALGIQKKKRGGNQQLWESEKKKKRERHQLRISEPQRSTPPSSLIYSGCDGNA